MHCLCIEPILCKHRNKLVAENLDVRLRPRITKRFEGGQSENEIADCAAADHQDAVHASAVAAFYERRNSLAGVLSAVTDAATI
jgi:hypothetical protein